MRPKNENRQYDRTLLQLPRKGLPFFNTHTQNGSPVRSCFWYLTCWHIASSACQPNKLKNSTLTQLPQQCDMPLTCRDESPLTVLKPKEMTRCCSSSSRVKGHWPESQENGTLAGSEERAWLASVLVIDRCVCKQGCLKTPLSVYRRSLCDPRVQRTRLLEDVMS